MSFANPELLYVIPLVVLLAFVFRFRSRASIEAKRFGYLVASVCLVIVAAANPYWQTIPAKEKIKGADLVLITDVSQSMFSVGSGKTSRIDQARKMIHNLLPQFTGSQIALIYFAADAQIGSPFTTDVHSISLLIDSISPGMTAEPGTHSQSLEQAIRQTMTSRPAGKMPVIFFFSDGEFFDSTSALEAYIKEENLRVFSYLTGDQKAAVLNYELTAAVPNAFTTPDEASLRRIAKAGNGEFFNLTREPANAISAKLNFKIEDMIREGQSVPDYRPVPFLLIAFLFLLLYQWIPARPSFVKQASAGTLLVFLATSLSMSPDESRTIFKQAMDAMNKGKSDEAIGKLKSLPDDFFAADKAVLIGNIHYKAGKPKEAIRYYQQAIELDPFHSAARWNWEVALKQQSDSAQPPPKPREEQQPQQIPQNQNALLQYVDQLEKEQRQKSNRSAHSKSKFAW